MKGVYRDTCQEPDLNVLTRMRETLHSGVYAPEYPISLIKYIYYCQHFYNVYRKHNVYIKVKISKKNI